MNNILSVFKYTFIEVVRSKLMVLTPIISAVIIFISYLSSSFAYGAPGRVAIDVGLGLMSLSNLIVAILVGATLVSKEIESKTIYMIISKPISRSHFLVGKVFGLGSFLVINMLVQGTVCAFLYKFFNGPIPELLIYVCLFSLFEAFIIMLISIMFSLISNVSLTVIFTVLVWVAGSIMSETQKISFLKNNKVLVEIIQIASKILPDFSKYNVKDFVLYQQTLPMGYLEKTILYFILYSLFIFIGTSILFNKKDLN